MSDKLLTTKEAAALVGLSPRSLEQYRWRGTGPKYVKEPGKQGVTRGRYGGAVHYREQDLLDWLGESREESSMSSQTVIEDNHQHRH